MDPPATDTLIGTIALGRSATADAEGGKRFLRVLVGWSEYAVAVQVAYIDGTILAPIVEEEDKDNADGSGSGSSQATSIKDQADYFNSLDPRKLGLEAESMLDYTVYPQQGWVMVDDVECREIRVYQMDPQTATNKVVGTFYLSSDLTQLYKKTGDDQIVPVQMD